MSTRPQAPARLASEDVIISAPLSYAGSAQRIYRLRRRANTDSQVAAITTLAVLLIVLAWVFVTVWYLVWGVWLVPYRLARRGARKRKVEALRHRELMGTVQGSAAASAAAMVAAMAGADAPPSAPSLSELVADADRERAIGELREHMLAGRLTTVEFEERLVAAHNARTRGDLAAVTLNLPLNGRAS